VINYRWGIVPALFALLVSVLLGLISGAGFSHVFLRALVFAIVFFGLGIGMWFVVNAYFPELLVNDDYIEQDDEKTGSRVDITVDNAGEYAVPELYKNEGNPDELGNIDDLLTGAFKARSRGVDRKQEEGYNETREEDIPDDENIDFQDMFQDAGGYEKSPEEKLAFTPRFADDSGELGDLPDLDAMAMAFSSGGSLPDGFSGSSKGSSSGFSGFSSASDDIEEASSFPSSSTAASSPYVGNKPQPLKGDFNPKEIAEGIRTILSKDK